MLISFTCQGPGAPEVGFVLGKHPDALFCRESAAGQVYVFYSAVAEDAVTVDLFLEVDPIHLVRSHRGGIDQYVNDRPYVASSLMSVAIHTAFSSALAGHSAGHPELVTRQWHWAVHLPAVPCSKGAAFIDTCFRPLGYSVVATPLPSDGWGEQADGPALFDLRLSGQQTVQAMLAHLYVLIPVLHNTKHYFVGEDEARKCITFGGIWLAQHPAREVITQRYLRYQRDLVAIATAGLAEVAPELPPVGAEHDASCEPSDLVGLAPDLHTQRLQAVMAVMRDHHVTTLADLGCGEGRLLQLALAEPALKRILGMDVAATALARASVRLGLADLAPADRERITLVHGSLIYRDPRLTGFDGAALVEVIEHLDQDRLEAMAEVVFGEARPRVVVITTPNREWNIHFAPHDPGRLRHGDHRFEWTRGEGQDWAASVAQRYGYQWQISGVGADDPQTGPPTQLFVFARHPEHMVSAIQAGGTHD